jgi:hypothetical protein
MYMKRLQRPLVILGLVLILLFSFSTVRNRREGLTGKTVEIVVARYNENLEWLKTEPFNKYDTIIYNKGTNENFAKPANVKRVVPLKNVGKCDHTYLYHIIKNYNNLADITAFLPGSVDMSYKIPKATQLMESIERKNKAVFINEGDHKNVKQELYDFTLDEWKTSNETNQSKNPESRTTPAPIRPFGRWFEANFGDIEVSKITYTGIFSVAKEDIMQHPLEYYERLESQLSTSSNPEVGHYFERAWAAVFHPMNNTVFI